MSEILGLPREALDRARRSRDPRFDGKFFIAVLSTGIYCRTICPVRLSAAVRYYATAAEAEEAGFRPCLRCRPEAAPGSPAWTGTSAVVRRALRLIGDGALDRCSVKELATLLGMGARHLNRLLVEQVGASPLAIAQTRRLHFAKQLLNDTDLRMTEIALAAGFRSVRRFNEALKATYQRSPSELRRRSAHVDAKADQITLNLAYRPPYDWASMLACLGERAIPGLECVDAQSYARVLRTSSGRAVIQVSACGRAHSLQIRIRGAPPADLMEISSTARRVFDLSADTEQIAVAFGADPILARLLARRSGMRLPGVFDPFECAVRAVIGQQSNLQAAREVLGRLVTRAGESIEPMNEGLTHLFPTVDALATLDLRKVGLDAAFVEPVQGLARAVVEGKIRFNDPIEGVTRALTKLRGAGAWVAQYVALYGFGEPDALPTEDLNLRRAAAGRGPPLTARAFEARAESWRPWRGYAAIHLWAAATEGHNVDSKDRTRRASVQPAPQANALIARRPEESRLLATPLD